MKHLLLLAVVLLSGVSLWATLRGGVVKHLSVSLHVARTKEMRMIFGGTAFVAALCMAFNFFGWLLPRYEAMPSAYFLFGLVVLCFIIVALIPHIEGSWRGQVHNMAAWGLVYLIPFVLIQVLFWPLACIVFWVDVVILAGALTLLLLSLFRKELRQWFLYYQVAYLSLFFLFLLSITYY